MSSPEHLIAAFSIEQSQYPTPPAQRQRLLDNPAWGQVFTDHMFSMHYAPGRGWHDGKIIPCQPMSMHPAAMVLHYGLEIFEGMKAYRLPDGGAALFRPQANARRFDSSAQRLGMPPLPEGLLVASAIALVRHEHDWIPRAEGASLYLRPFMISTEVALGVRPSQHFLYAVLASPVSGYFAADAATAAVTVWVSEGYIRAAPGGTGAAKCGGNYASGLVAQAQAREHGCDQVVFLDAIECKWIEEFGAMNAFFVLDNNTLVTPPLSGTILPGITRDSLITLAREQGYTVCETPYSIDQWQDDARSGRLREAFACGTAAVITPVGRVKGRRHDFVIGDGKPGPVTLALRQALTDIQFGRVPDSHGWSQRVG